MYSLHQNESQTVLCTSEGQEQNVTIATTGEQIAQGTHASIEKVLVDGVPMVRKSYLHPGDADRAFDGSKILQRNLPDGEKELCVHMMLDAAHNAVITPILNKHAFVISMGKNRSKDRENLSKNKLNSIPNFSDVVLRLLDAVQAYGDKGLPIGPDVYFLVIDYKTNVASYRYADTESVSTDQQMVSSDEIPLVNIYWAAGMLNHFLQECVQDPEGYLVRVRQEAIHRMNSYHRSDRHWQNELLKGKEFSWPSSTWKQALAGTIEVLKKNIVAAWKS